MSASFRIFAEQGFERLSRELFARFKEGIYHEDKNYLLNVNRTEYINHVVSQFEITPLELDFQNMTVSSSEKLIPAEHFPSSFNVYQGKSYPKQVVKYHVPFTGEERLLKCLPNPQILNSYPVSVEGGEVCFEIIDFYGDPEPIKRKAESALRPIQQQYGYLVKNVQNYNAALRPEAEKIFDARKAEVMKQNKVVAALGVPVKKAANIPDTFAVPAVSRRRVTPRPKASAKPYEPEPTVDEAEYEDILKSEVQRAISADERLPRTYADKGEETLRDHLIMVLEPRFEISTTGETFNKSGKTDILMRHDGKNVFVAECKFWRGAKQHHKTIDQLLSYLTWRDSKTAIVYFMDTQDIVAPLKAIEETTPEHPCFVADKGKREESWFQYEFHLPGDESRSVHISMLCFHLPKARKSRPDTNASRKRETVL